MTKVAYLTPLYFDEHSYLGGGERYPLNLAKGVALTGGYSVELTSYGEPHLAGTRVIERDVSLRILPTARRKAGTERLSWDVLDVVEEADLVHIHQVFARSSEVALMAAKFVGRPCCVTDHGGTSSRLGQSMNMLDLADRVTAYSDFGASLLDTSTPKVIVRGGVDDRYFTPPPPARQRERRYVVYVGRLLPHKGIDRLIAALPEELTLHVCGRPYDERYFALLRRLARGKDVHFITDSTDAELRLQYQEALAVVLPSVYVDCFGGASAAPELMGLSLLEGMACGTPAICSRVGGMPEYVLHGTTGFVFDELAELSAQLLSLANDASMANRVGERAREEVERHYGLAPSGLAMRQVYESVL